MKAITVLLTTFTLSCASIEHKSLTSLHNVKDRLEYRSAPCGKELLDKSYARLLKAEGCSECALYYLRCSEPSALKRELQAIKARRFKPRKESQVKLSWNHIYLLAWWDANGRPLMTTWEGDLPKVFVVVTNARRCGPPLWDAPVDGAQLVCFVPKELPLDKKITYAADREGFLALGWYVESGIIRK